MKNESSNGYGVEETWLDGKVEVFHLKEIVGKNHTTQWWVLLWYVSSILLRRGILFCNLRGLKVMCIRFQSQVLFLKIIDVGAEVFTFTNLDHAKSSKDLILKSVRPWLRPFCWVKMVPVYE